MAALPTGTVTFLFTDMEGSTRHLSRLGPEYRDLLERHHAILRTAIKGNGGTALGTEGDAFFAVFAKAASAVSAAVDAQRAFHAQTWPGGLQVRVRMGLLTGEGALGADGYVGLDVHRAARVAAAAHGGQVLISDSTRTMAERALPAGVSVRDLGEHRFRDLDRPERVFQLIVEGLPADFPPLRSIDARRNNLPTWLSSFVGRRREIGEISDRLAQVRLLTLTGAGGTGKTRLAVRVAEELLPRYEHGSWFVGLEALKEPELLPSAIAHELGVGITGKRPLSEVLEGWLAERELLLVLDNLEQVAEGAPLIHTLLVAAPRMRVLATSRTPLHIYGESEYPVPPLALRAAPPVPGTSAAGPAGDEALQLFAERAVAARPAFVLDDSNAAAVADICARLDGLPLAIELAAAQTKVLSPEQIDARLADNMALPPSAAADVPERQRTLDATIDWSYRLLSDDQQRLFSRLSVFHGGIALEAGSQVAAPGLEIDALKGLTSLVDRSLLRGLVLAEETRFAMLGTVRRRAAELLASDEGEPTTTLRRHAEYFFELARASEQELTGANQTAWLDRLERERDNLRSAFTVAEEVGLVDEGLAAAGAMWRFWQQRAHFAEARSVFERLLRVRAASPSARAKALTGAGGIAYWQTDLDAMARWYTEARQIWESLGDRQNLAAALLDEAYVPMTRNDFASARELGARSRDLFFELGDEMGIARSETVIGVALYFQGDHRAAMEHYDQAAAIYRRRAEQLELADVLANVSSTHAFGGDWQQAAETLRESLTIFRAADNEVGVAMVLEQYAAAAAWLDEHERAARLFGFADATKDRLGGRPPPNLLRNTGYRARSREALGSTRFDELVAEGARLSQAEAIELTRFDWPLDAPPFPGLGGYPSA